MKKESVLLRTRKAGPVLIRRSELKKGEDFPKKGNGNSGKLIPSEYEVLVPRGRPGKNEVGMGTLKSMKSVLGVVFELRVLEVSNQFRLKIGTSELRYSCL